MKLFPHAVAAVIFFALFACSKPSQFLLLNNSADTIEVVQGRERITVDSGKYVELCFDPEMIVTWGGRTHRFRWRYPTPPSVYMEFGRPTERFAVSLESDGKVYARQIKNGKPADKLPPQPIGFPLTAEN